jgi:nucleotide-binding universal stress UspA family protein
MKATTFPETDSAVAVAEAEGVFAPTPERIKLKHILVPTDFSEPAKKALRYAASFAEQFDARITLLHVVEPIPFGAGVEAVPLMMPEDELAILAKSRLASLGRHEFMPLLQVSPMVSRGKAWQEIVAAARKTEADLILIATHGYTGLEHALLGSTAEKVVQHAPCPVLVVRETEREFV